MLLAVANVVRWAKPKGIRHHPAIQNLLVTCKAVEAMVMGAAEAERGMINAHGVAILLRRVWGTRKASAAANQEANWREVKGNKDPKWTSRVNWATLEEVDPKDDASGSDLLT